MENLAAILTSFFVSAIVTIAAIMWFDQRPNMPMPLAILLGAVCGGVAGFAAGTAAQMLFRLAA